MLYLTFTFLLLGTVVICITHRSHSVSHSMGHIFTPRKVAELNARDKHLHIPLFQGSGELENTTKSWSNQCTLLMPSTNDRAALDSRILKAKTEVPPDLPSGHDGTITLHFGGERALEKSTR